MQRRKIFILDIGVILSDPQCITDGFADNNILIGTEVLNKLYEASRLYDQTGSSAREAISIINGLIDKGWDLMEGAPVNSGGTLRLQRHEETSLFDFCINEMRCQRSRPDGYPSHPVILITNNPSTRIEAETRGILVEMYRNERVTNTSYTGHQSVNVSKDIIDEIYKKSKLDAIKIDAPLLRENEFVTLKCGSQSAMSVHQNDVLRLVKPRTLFNGVKTANEMQHYAAWALLAPPEEIPLVMISGPAGTAKTFLSLAAGLTQTYVSQRRGEGTYYKMLISRPNSEAADPGFGYLPGDLMDKMQPLLAPYYDNLESIFLAGDVNDHENVRMQIDDLFESGVLEICPLNYIRGRSLRNAYIICDEAQNATRSLIRDVITRCGEGSKVILLGDPDQVDAPSLNGTNNGLVYAMEKMRTKYAVTLKLDASCSVRSALATEAIKLMKS